MLPADSIHIEYNATAGCPSEAAFAWQVRARVRQVSAPARKYAVILTGDSPRPRGTLRVEEESRTSVRDISGASCDEIAEGLALILALVIDPGARTEPARELPPQPAPERAPESKASVPLPAPGLSAAPDSLAQSRAVSPVWKPSASMGATVVARSALAPGTTTSGRVFLEGGMDRRAAFSPHVRLAFEYAESSPILESVGTARFTWMAGTVQACHAEQVLERTLAVPVCAGFEWGRLEGSGSDTTDPQTQTQTWLALDAAVGLRWLPWSVPFFVDIEAGVQFPLHRARFYFAPSTTVHTTPRLAQFVGIGVGVRLF